MGWHAFIEKIIRQREGDTFLVDEVSRHEVSYTNFRELALSAAYKIQQSGIRRGERVAIICPNGIDFIVVYFACLYAGVVAVPLNPNLPETDLDVLLGLSNPSLVLLSGDDCQGVSAEKAKQLGQAYRVFDISRICKNTSAEPPPEFSNFEFSDDQLWTIHFTSGTTGTSKGVCHTPASLLGSAYAFCNALGFDSHLRMYHVLPMFYMAGFLNTLLCPFVSGGSVLVGRPFGPGTALNFWEQPRNHSVNILWLVPTMLVSLLKLDRKESVRDWVRQNIRMVLVGTAPLPIQVKNDFEAKYGTQVFQSYGLSETLFVSSNTLNSPRSEGAVGVAIDGVQIRIDHDAGHDLFHEAEGEILIRGEGVMAGYWNAKLRRPDRSLMEEWFYSGDIGRTNSSGELFITGRKKDIIVKGGENISPKKIMDVLLRHPGIEDAVVVGIPHGFYGEEVAAALRLKPGLRLSAMEQSIRQFCSSYLPANSVPTRFRQFEDFPRGSTGKILNREIQKLLASEK